MVLVFALVALYAAQAEQSGPLGSLGMALSAIGSTLASAVVFVEIARASGVEVEAVLGASIPGALNVLGGLAFLIGLILFGVATMRADVFPRWAGLIVGDVELGAGSFAGPVVGAAITCAGFVWLGLALLSGPGSDAAARHPRVS